MTRQKAFTPTPSQHQAISARGQNILVNAGAGAGKTATLSERVIGRLLDVNEPLSLEQMVIVTFTRAAAAEMRERIGAKIRASMHDALESGDEETARRLDSEIQSLPRAQITTLHSYCSMLLREFGDRIDVPPDFELIDEDEALLFKIEQVHEEMESIANDPIDGAWLREVLQQISPTVGSKEVEKLSIRLQHFLDSLDAPEMFVSDILRDCDSLEGAVPFEETLWYKQLSEFLQNEVAALREQFHSHVNATRGLTLTCSGPINVAAAARASLEALEAFEASQDFESYLSFRTEGFAIPRRTSPGKNGTEGDIIAHEHSKGMKDRIDSILKAGSFLCDFTSLSDVRQNIAQSVPFVRLLIGRLGFGMNQKLLAEHLAMRRLRFADLERLALHVLENPDGSPTEAALTVRARTAEILVDEFQDVNSLQARLLRAIARPDDDSRGGNLFVVGDLKQSIYGFRQADPRKFKELYRLFRQFDEHSPQRPGARIDLVENYRSAPALLALLNDFFERLFTEQIGQVDFDASHRFVPGLKSEAAAQPRIDVLLLDKSASDFDSADASQSDGEEGPVDSSVDSSDDVLSMEQFEDEARAVAEEIQSLHLEGVPLGDIAILTRAGKGAATKLAEVFQHVGIPFHTEAATGFLKQQEVQDFTALLRVLDNPYDDVAVVGVLRGPVGEWSEDDLVQLRLVDRQAALIDNLNVCATDFEHPLFVRAIAVTSRLTRWREASRRRPMAELFALLLEENDWCARVATLPNGDLRVANLHFLMQRGTQFDSFQRKGLTEFLRFLEQLAGNDRDLGSPPSAPGNDNVVRIMTIHKSKGLQFPVVIVPFMGAAFNLGDLKSDVIWDRDGGVACRYLKGRRWGEETPSLAKQFLKNRIRERLLSEELRLLYVALTRAEKRLLLIGSGRKIVDDVQAALEKEASGSPSWRPREIANAKCLLDWVLIGFANRPELATFAENATPAPDGFRVRFSHANAVGQSLGQSNETTTERRDAAQSHLEANTATIEGMIRQVNRLDEKPRSPRLKVKVTATEAKRAWLEQFNEPESEGNVVGWTAKRSSDASDLPDWWPSTLKTEKPSRGRHRGNINHRFLEKVDFTALTRGMSLESEVERMVIEGLIEEEERDGLLLENIRQVLEMTRVGRDILARAHTVRREAPFRIGIPTCDLIPDHPLQNDLIMMQGVIDLIYENASGDLVIVDWKTDWWDGTASRLEELADSYRPQVQLYMEGLQRAAGKRVASGWLVFIEPAQPMEVEASRDKDNWLEIVRAAVSYEGKARISAP